MTIHPLFLSLAFLLLWFPRQWLRFGGGRRGRRGDRSVSLPPFLKSKRSEDQPPRDHDDRSVSLGSELRKRRNYIDLLRGVAGSIALTYPTPFTSSSFTLAPHAPPETGHYLLSAIGAIATVGVIIQTLRFEGRLGLFAPIFYLSGLSVGFCGTATACLALVMIWAISFTLSNPEYFLICYAALLGIFAFVFLDENKLVLAAVTCVLVFLPALMSMLMQKSLVLSFKQSSRASNRS